MKVPVRTRLAGYNIRTVLTEAQPIFVVGCGHSGTTLLATLLARHVGVMGIGEETGAFMWRYPAYACGAVRQWDTLATQFGAKAFLEKTPKHVVYISRILRMLPHARIVGAARCPMDNVASLYERTGRLKGSIKRYNVDNSALCRHAQHANVIVCHYESLVADPGPVLQRISEHCGLPHDADHFEEGGSIYERWENEGGNKSRRAREVTRGVYDSSGRWREVLTPDEGARVLEATRKVSRRLGYEYGRARECR